MADPFNTAGYSLQNDQRFEDFRAPTPTFWSRPLSKSDILTLKTYSFTSLLGKAFPSQLLKQINLVCDSMTDRKRSRLTSRFNFTFSLVCFRKKRSTIRISFCPFLNISGFHLKYSVFFLLYFLFIAFSFFPTCNAFDYGIPTIKSDGKNKLNIFEM